MLMRNILTLTDSYKVSHYRQYPPTSQIVASHLMPRGVDPIDGSEDPWTNEILSAGFQFFTNEFLTLRVTQEDIDFAAEFWGLHFNNSELFNRAGWEYILKKHDGRLPVRVRAVPEGTIVSPGNVMMTMENTDPACYWLTNYLETLAVQAVWYPTSVATVSREMKRVILNSLKETGDPAGISFKLHDFGFRGVSSVESAAIGGFAHLINFLGTDTSPALLLAREHYDCKMAGFSIPAAEHSTITSWGRNRETEAYENMLTQYPEGLVAVVSDSYDIISACKNIWGDKLRPKVLARKGTVVIRPDSGVPHEMVVKVLNTLGDYFEPTVNAKGFKVLPPQVRIIQGDGIDLSELKRIARALKTSGWSMDNVAFGSGGALLQKSNRDTLKFAFKCNAIKVGGDWADVYKRPADAPWKASRRGLLKLVQNPDGGFITLRQDQPGKDCLEEIFRDGKCLTRYTLDDIRKRAAL